jgi:ABC-2 type transport system permease protein
MLRSVLGRTLHARRRSIIGWGLGIAALAGITLAFWPIMPDTSEMEQLLEQMPEGMLAAFGMAEVDDLFSPTGYLDSQLFAMISPLVLLIFAVGGGAAAIAGDEERGTLELLLAQPLSRTRVLLERSGGLALLVTALVVLHGVVLAVGAAIVDLDVAVEGLVGIHVSLLLLLLLFAGVGIAVGAGTGRRGLAIAVSAAIAVVGYLLDSFAPLVDWLEPFRAVSPFYLYRGADPLAEGLEPVHATALAVATLVALAIAVWTFERRDVGTG